jgi:hypothetical protein
MRSVAQKVKQAFMAFTEENYHKLRLEYFMHHPDKTGYQVEIELSRKRKMNIQMD